MSIVSAVGMRCLKRVGFATLCAAGMVIGAEVSPAVDALPNACPVDGCSATIIGVERSGDELQLTLKANFSPDRYGIDLRYISAGACWRLTGGASVAPGCTFQTQARRSKTGATPSAAVKNPDA